jgi:hypothetical protein
MRGSVDCSRSGGVGCLTATSVCLSACLPGICCGWPARRELRLHAGLGLNCHVCLSVCLSGICCGRPARRELRLHAGLGLNRHAGGCACEQLSRAPPFFTQPALPGRPAAPLQTLRVSDRKRARPAAAAHGRCPALQRITAGGASDGLDSRETPG